MSVVVEDSPWAPELPMVNVPLQADDAGPEASAFIEEALKILAAEASRRCKLEKRCQRIVISLHALITLALLAEVTAAALSEYHILTTAINVSVSLAIAGLNVVLLHLVRRVSATQKQHHHVYVESSSLHTRLLAKRSHYLADGVISGREFGEMEKEFVAFTRRCADVPSH